VRSGHHERRAVSAVKSVTAHIVLQTVAKCGFGSGIKRSSVRIGCGFSPDKIAIDESD